MGLFQSREEDDEWDRAFMEEQNRVPCFPTYRAYIQHMYPSYQVTRLVRLQRGIRRYMSNHEKRWKQWNLDA